MSMLKRLELFEHQTVRIGEPLRTLEGDEARLTEREFDALNRFNDANEGRFFRMGHRRFTTTQHVGYLEVGGLAIEILPKADRSARHADARPWREGLLDMLRVASGLRLQAPTPASQRVAQSTLLEIVALRFIEEAERLLHEGLAKGYRDTEANGSTFRGRLLFAQHVRENIARADRCYVRYTTFDRDVVANRILLQALEMLSQLALSPGISARGNTVRAAFPELDAVRITPEVFERLQLSRATARYGNALALARMILEQQTPQLRAGDVKVFALLFDMNALWERYVAALFRRAAPPGLAVSMQESRKFWTPDARPSRKVRPDVVVRDRASDRAVLVVDTKWKVLSDGTPSDEDLRQMFVYNELFGAPRAFLVYPRVESATPRSGVYAGRGHSCGTLHLGLFDAGRWSPRRMQAEVEALLQGVDPTVHHRETAAGAWGSARIT